ncbi:MAG: GNAT family N-acetyltransferase [Defluviitaleaceae bacterium]|nr:GNAT family N-acetyltransferase [Defluviitaleaceae bacterium]MCL2836474.1 GNAT family N-acetyltransferase [Defluviitaleaceae bacterium]
MKQPITGSKVILRELRDGDAAFFAHWYNQPEVMFQCGFHEQTTLEAELAAIRKPEADRDWYAVTDLSGRLVGETGLLRMWPHWRCTDLTIIIPDPADQGKGYGACATRLMLNRAFSHHGMNRVSIGVVGLNTQALTFYKRLGFKQEGIQEQGYFHNGRFSDFIMMRILESEFNRKEYINV